MTAPSGLVVRGLSVSYGGLHAVSGVSLDAPVGRITGLIGPNGAGKTTTFNALSGILRHDEGSITLDGGDLGRMPAARRAGFGLGRTFQRMELCDGLTVRQNVALGRESRLAGSAPSRHLFSSRQERNLVYDEVEAALALCGIGHLSSVRVGGIPTGQKRLVELARVIAGGFRIMLLDEPSSGLDTAETARFGAILQELKRRGDVGILLVEHDMALVMEVCDYIYVIDFGQPIFEGEPREVAMSDQVKAAYLGSDELTKL